MAEWSAEAPLTLMGAPGSPYTRKMVALLRYRRIPYALQWGGHRASAGRYPEPKVKLLPTFYFRRADDTLEAVVDSTPIIRRLEQGQQERSVLPDHPALAFLNELIEDYADEWLTKAMFHYRWAYPADIANAGPLLVYWHDPTLEHDTAMALAQSFADRQVSRLYVVGSNETTGPIIEDSYRRLLTILDGLVQAQGYVLGARPSSADFALYGQLTQLAIVDPTPAQVAQSASPRVRAWIDRVEDLSGLTPSAEDWLSPDAAKEALQPLLSEIGRVYAPFLLANAKAVLNGQQTVEARIDGRVWVQPTFPYQAKCLGWLREAYGALAPSSREQVDAILAGTGCAVLFA